MAQGYTAGITLLQGLELPGQGGTTKLPPSYEDVMQHAIQHQQQNLDTYYPLPPQQNMMMRHGNTLSPPHSASSVAMSPPNSSYVGSPSPAKIRPNLPTSPTHMQAMRAAQQKQFAQMQAQQGFEYQQQEAMYHYYQSAQPQNTYMSPDMTQLDPHSPYLTPQSQDLAQALQPEHFPTPSPESIQSAQSVNSPDHWSSSSSPPAQSDWSDCIQSPPQGLLYHPTPPTQNKQPEAIYI